MMAFTTLFRSHWAGFVLLLFCSIFAEATPTIIGSKMDCVVLQKSFANMAYLPATAQYENSTSSYFAAFENELNPAGVFQPQSTQDVVKIVQYLRTTPTGVKIAIRGGGHTPWAGAANIDKGITIDMRRLTGVKVRTNNVATIAAGETWGSVYTTLEKQGLAVVGGRVSKVGVTGLTIGGKFEHLLESTHLISLDIGGLSYFSGKMGWVCDSVTNFEVVLSSGKIVQANKNSNAELFRALKGGTNNFGIVTRIDLPTFTQGQMWGGALFYDATTYEAIVNAFYDFASKPTPDQDAHVIAAASFSPMGFVNVVNTYYTKPTANPPSLVPFTNIQPQLGNTLREDSLLGFANEQAAFSTDGERQQFFTTSFKLGKQFMLDIHSLFANTVDSLKNVPGFTVSMVFQHVTKQLLQNSAAKGQNSLGVSPSDGPFVVCLLNAVHSSPADDTKIVKGMTSLRDSIGALAQKKGLGRRYRFMNYASKDQDAIEAYGPQNVKFLQGVSEKYDPSGFFQNRVPGGFKLS